MYKTLLNIPFYKMHAIGNDFVIIDSRKHNVALHSNEIKNICHRKFGVGCDQLAIIKDVDKAYSNSANFTLFLYNQDGTVAGMCGNAIRCASGLLFLLDAVHNNKISFHISTTSIVVNCHNVKNDIIAVDMGTPRCIKYNTETLIDIGNLHKIIITNELDELGLPVPYNFMQHKDYNVSYIYIVDKNTIYITTIERGVGQTLSCCSGACASAYWTYKNMMTNEKVLIKSHGSILLQDSGLTISINNSDRMTSEGTWKVICSGIL